MKPAAFRYHAPKTVDEAIALLAEFADDDGRVLAGGQSLVPTMAFRLARPAHLVDINDVEALNRIALDGGKIAEPRLAIGGAEVNPRRIAQAERALAGAAPGDQAFRAAAQAAMAAIDPMEDIINSAEFRRDLVLAVARRALERAAA